MAINFGASGRLGGGPAAEHQNVGRRFEMRTTSTEVRGLLPEDAQAFVRIRRDALESEPFAFTASVHDDRGLSIDFVREALSHPDQATYGAFLTGLVGVVGIRHDRRQAKTAHKAYLWGMYVIPEKRKLRIGRSLTEAALSFASQASGVTQVHLSVAESASAAIALYEELGFVRWGTEPEAMRVGARSVAEHHMILNLAKEPV